MRERESNAVDSRTKKAPSIGFSEQQLSPVRDESKRQISNPLPAVSLPKGGGAIRGIGEKFTANPVTGTGSLSVPITTSPGRSGFGPQLSLSYDSGAGNGPFGYGWNLSLPSITRKTDKGLPKYMDAEESDVFILSGSEDLVPILVNNDGQWQRDILPPREMDGKEYKIQRYRPRIEGLFALIERWTEKNDPKDTFWRSISKDNITTWYGKNDQSRIADPADPTHVFTWLICESYDDKGNAIIYEYVPEDSANIDLSWANECNRTEEGRAVNRYLKRIKYGNKTSRLIQPDLSQIDWLFEVVLDYDEGHYFETTADAAGCIYAMAVTNKTHDWSTRLDSFSSYRSGFEIRTYRLCRRVLMFHHFPDELGVDDYLVRSTEFEYAESHVASFITSVTQSGYKRQEDNSYIKKSLPPLEFEYSQAVVNEDVQEIDAESLENMPVGLDGTTYKWVDLDGEGISGILSEQADAWFYKTNLGEGRFGPLKQIMKKPSLAALGNGRQQLLDLAGDGQLDLAEFGGPTPGFYERTHDEDWEPFKPFLTLPNIPWDEPNLRFVDLNGDGHADVLITEHEVFTWHQSLAEKGFNYGGRIPQVIDEEKGPRLIFADGTQSIYLSDLSGDGLADLVRIRNGEVCYWPNLGYGRFGAKIAMDNPPWFETSDQFDQQRIRLADIDGSGTIDIIYLSHRGAQLYLNQSGNSWSEAQLLSRFPSIDNLSSVMVVDLFGNGTACLVWSSPLPGNLHKPMRYIDLMGGMKPHLLTKVVNNLGAETHVHYAPSTKFYLADKADGKPWVTKLPFPVHVVERVDTYDCISRNRFVTRYAYHHGYFDGEEREFRGFGMVEQWDTEEFATLNTNDEFPQATNIDEASHVPPILTKTWFHTGTYLGRNNISNFFAGLLDANDIGEYYREPGLTDAQARELLLEDTVLPAGLTVDEEREACRALKGLMLRQEVYAFDGTDKEQHPYTVTEQNFTVHPLQPKADNRHGVFFTHAREAINYHYERNPDDPRISHAMTLEVDDFGNVLKEAAIGYGRRQPNMNLSAEERAKQTRALVTYTENSITNAIEATDDYRTPLPCEIRTYELTGYSPTGAAGRFQVSDLVQPDPTDPSRLKQIHTFDGEVDYEDVPPSGRQRRLIEHIRTLYRPDDLGVSLNDPLALLPFETIESLALSGETYKLAFTPGLLAQVYQRPREGQPPENLLPNPDDMLPVDLLAGQVADRGGYVDMDSDGHWWIPSGRTFLSTSAGETATQELTHAHQHFFLPQRYRNPFGQTSNVTYDDYDLLTVETRDALDNRVTSDNDYRVLQSVLVTDPNQNRTTVAIDTLGMVTGTAVMGKSSPAPQEGDSLNGFEADLTETVVLDHLANPLTDPHAILNHATTRLVYDLFAYHRSKDQPDPQPAVVYTLAREIHDADLDHHAGEQTRIQHSFSYSDGFGRNIQQKIQAEPGPVPQRDAEGKIIVGSDGQPEMTTNDVSPRWVGGGWAVFNNKGKPVRQYEPFFTDTHRFEFDVRIGVSLVLFYDPIERVVATLHPNYTWEKIVFDAWRQESWDVNDTVLIADPKKDNDMGDFFRLLPDNCYLPTWHGQRVNGALGPQEQAAAIKTAIHADTPTIAHLDSLGRTFLTVAHNKYKRSDTPPTDPPIEEFYSTRIVFDIEGNQREVLDAKDRVVMQYDYTMVGPKQDENGEPTNTNCIHQASMEGGERWILNDVAGKPIYGWNSRGHRMRTTYDELRRPTGLYVSTNGHSEVLAEKTVYGETLLNPEQFNHRGRVYQVFDGAGAVTSQKFDFKGNLISGHRQLLQDYKNQVDWTQPPSLESEIFTGSTCFDALNRAVQIIAPHSDRGNARINIIQPTYNEANFLERVDVWMGQNAMPEVFLNPVTANLHAVENIDYDAKGQRTRIEYGNKVFTSYEYDPDTFRLMRLKTIRSNGGHLLQDVQYVYDPAGNVTSIRDDAQQTVFFNNAVVEPHSQYIYDALYRLIESTGREHIGQVARPETSWNDEGRTDLGHPSDGQQMRGYKEHYEYDEVGNILNLIHQANNGNWTRAYSYNEASLVEPGKKNNRLSATTVGSTTVQYEHNEHGSITKMPHLPIMEWDFKDQLQVTERQVVNNGNTAERTYYIYDAAGERVRKVTERQNGTRKKERLYLSGFEIYRDYNGNGITIELQRETLHIMDDTQRIAMVETKTIDTNNDPSPTQLIRYQFGNHLGSASLELDCQAQIISYEEYAPFGSTSYQAVRGQIQTPKRYRYTGKERDLNTGLYHHGARYYAPWLGRWVSCDPLGIVDGSNLYRYVSNNPLLFVDKTGESGIAFKLGNDLYIAGSSEQLLGAGRAMVRRIQSELKEYFGIETKIEDIFLFHHGVNYGVPPKLIGFRLILSDKTSQKLALRQLEKYIRLKTMQELADKPQEKILSEVNKRIAQAKQIRGFLLKQFKEGHTVALENRKSLYPLANKVKPFDLVPLIGMETSAISRKMRANPYTWFRKKENRWIDSLEGTERGLAALGPALQMLHEFEHVTKTFISGKGFKFADWITEETAVLKDIDASIAGHPSIAERKWYGSAANKPGDRYVLGDFGKDVLQSDPVPNNADWVRWPTEAQLEGRFK